MLKTISCRCLAIAGLATCILGGRATAAQHLLTTPTAIAVGGYFPSGSDAKDRGGSTQISADLRYTISPPSGSSGTNSLTVLSAGVEAGAKDGNHSTIVPVTIGEVLGGNNQSPYSSGNYFYGAGVGAYFLNQSGLSTATRLGGYAQLGYNFTNSLFGEAKYQWVDHGNGPIVNLGYRF